MLHIRCIDGRLVVLPLRNNFNKVINQYLCFQSVNNVVFSFCETFGKQILKSLNPNPKGNCLTLFGRRKIDGDLVMSSDNNFFWNLDLNYFRIYVVVQKKANLNIEIRIFVRSYFI